MVGLGHEMKNACWVRSPHSSSEMKHCSSILFTLLKAMMFLFYSTLTPIFTYHPILHTTLLLSGKLGLVLPRKKDIIRHNSTFSIHQKAV